jgi:hypothetical protein
MNVLGFLFDLLIGSVYDAIVISLSRYRARQLGLDYNGIPVVKR